MGNSIQVDHDAVISEPLVFHDIHAESIEISNNNRRARRIDGLQGMCFSQRPILQNELVCLRITESSSTKRNKGGLALRFGYTAIDPSAGNLNVISALASAGHGYWVKAVTDSIVKRGVAVFFYLSESGEVIYGRKDKDYGVLFSGVRTGVPLWVVIDMAGSASTLEFLDGSLGSLKTETSKRTQAAIAKFESRQPNKSTLSRSSDALSSSSSDAAHQTSRQASQDELHSGRRSTTGRFMQRNMSTPDAFNQLANIDSRAGVRTPDEENQNISTNREQPIVEERPAEGESTRSAHGANSRSSRRNRRHSSLIPTLSGDPNVGIVSGSSVSGDPTSSTASAPDTSSTSSNQNSGAELSQRRNSRDIGGATAYPRHSPKVTEPMAFHGVKFGRNVMLSDDRLTATRRPGEFSNAYVFTEKPLLADDELVFKIEGINDAFIGGLTIGLTTCNPSDMRQLALPDDPHQLLDRPEYWVLKRNIHNRPKVGNEICFHLTKSGELRYFKNGRECGPIMHVDCSLPLWLFVDIYGTTNQIQSTGVIRRSLLQNGNHGFISSPPRERASRSADGNRPPAESSTSSRSRHGRRTVEPGAIVAPPGAIVAPNVSAASHNQSNGTATRGEVPNIARLSIDTSSTSTSRQPVSSESSESSRNRQQSAVSLNAMSSNPMTDLLSEPLSRLPPPLIPLPAGSDLAVSNDLVVLNDELVAPAKSSKSGRAFSNVECAICLENEPDSALYPCGHMCMCYGCAVSVQSQRSALCPMCRQPIVDILRIYRS